MTWWFEIFGRSAGAMIYCRGSMMERKIDGQQEMKKDSEEEKELKKSNRMLKRADNRQK